MFRPWSIWLWFAFCLAVVLAAMGWASRAVLRLEEARRLAQYSAALEENVRLALWRMDTAVAPLLAEESARPHSAYQPFYEPRPAVAADHSPKPGRLLAPSPLLREPPEHVLLYFQFEQHGRLTSPRAPRGEWRAVAVPKFLSEEEAARVEQRLADLQRQLDRDRLLASLPEQPALPSEWVLAPLVPGDEQQAALRQRRADLERQGRGAVEFGSRAQAVMNVAALSQQQLGDALPDAVATDVGGAPMTPLWLDGQLLLARRMTANGSHVVQGCLLDWPAIRDSLLESVADLLPGAELVAVDATGDGIESRRLAALPVRVVPGRLPAADEGSPSALRLSLIVAWSCMLLAAAAVAALLHGVMQLSERRAAFVSAVTHELRTPLTTFQMYAEMLADGMVTEESQRTEYLATLRREASRLIHLVENVLSYARLERGRAGHRTECLTAAELLGRVAPRLADRARQAAMELETDLSGPAAAATLRTDAGAVEQILFNLVDNACKYAPAAEDRRIHLAAALVGGRLELSVRDHGPGVAPGAARRIFRPFAKSARNAAESAPGVGLGLALSRRLARQLGGDLRSDTNWSQGAGFLLTLPAETAILK
ncbi:MAG: HAMP domain-containing sensor histidine kinase [Thermoguttaceae bacterium]|jgi:signal transduction histidine kinase|nr:HAMP domain-containing sensor histidine kinase [Thermoguttaceae bacterium]